jgi:undecaprenyl diphosphate synthase
VLHGNADLQKHASRMKGGAGEKNGLHVAIIMDGNGRWAASRNHPRTFGHAEGANAVRRVVEAAPQLGISMLTLYAFSSDNWQRPPREVAALMRLLRKYVHAETQTCVEKGVRVSVMGRRDRIAPALVRAIEGAEDATRDGSTLHLRVAIDYSSRDAILRAAQMAAGGEPPSRERFSQLIAQALNVSEPVPEVDLLIRTGGEKRLSDFLLWECAYAELVFTPRLWPDFDAHDLSAALREFSSRDRRFGRIEAQAAVG